MTIKFFIPGAPVPKQSYRHSKFGGYTDPRVKVWQNTVKAYAMEAVGVGFVPLKGKLSVSTMFVVKDRRKRDMDNLKKAVYDACNGVVWDDDTQIHVNSGVKIVKADTDREMGVYVIVSEISDDEHFEIVDEFMV